MSPFYAPGDFLAPEIENRIGCGFVVHPTVGGEPGGVELRVGQAGQVAGVVVGVRAGGDFLGAHGVGILSE